MALMIETYNSDPGGLRLRGSVGIAVVLLHGLAMAWLLWGGKSEASPTPTPEALMVVMMPAPGQSVALQAPPPRKRQQLTSEHQAQPEPQAPAAPSPMPVEAVPSEPVAEQPPGSSPEPTLAPPATVPLQNVRLAYLNNPPPKYSERLRRLGIEGRNHVRVLVSPEGHVLQVELQSSSGNAELDAATMTAVRRWKFEHFPSTEPAWAIIPFEFKLEK